MHRVSLTGGGTETAEPDSLIIQPGAYVEFVTADWLIHEVIFDPAQLTPDQWSFLESSNQAESPPLLELGSRYVLAFEGAPTGRYPFRIEGNGNPGQGVIVVADPLER